MEAARRSSKFHMNRPRLDRRNANKSINFDARGSIGRRRVANGDVDEEESDASNHSAVDDWSVDEFSVHDKQDVQEMNEMFRYLGLPGPAGLGITSADWAVRNTPTGSPIDGQLSSRRAETHRDFSFMPDSDRDSAPPKPSPRPPQKSPTFPAPSATRGEPTTGRSQLHQARAGAFQVRVQDTSPPSQRAAAAVATESAPAAQASRDSDGSSRRGKPANNFPTVVRQAMAAEAQRILTADAAAVSNFIDRHGDEERSRSLPDLEGDQAPSSPSDRSAGHQIARAQSEPIFVSSLRPGETSLLDEKNITGAGFKEQQNVNNGQQVSAGQQRSSKQDTGPADSASPVEAKPSLIPTVSRGPPQVLSSQGSLTLKPPPRMSFPKIPQEQFSTMDMLRSFAPDSNEPALLLSSDEEKEESEGEEVLSENELTGGTGKSLPVSDGEPEQSKHVSNGAVDEVKLEEHSGVLTVEVPHRAGEQLKLNAIGQNPDYELPGVARPPQEYSASLTFPWTKGELLGQGSFGTVYEAVDSEGMFFAVKEVSMLEQDKQAQQSIAQLMQEIELLSQFKHDNIVQYLGTEKAHGKLYIFLELVSKGSLAAVCRRIKLSHSQISAYTRQILKGLKYLHDQSIVHRDIKCANILVDVRGTCKLADFGMAKQIGSLDQTKSCKGSAYWMAPEVIDPKKTYGPPADIWSLGCSILELATGHPPFGDMEWYRVLWTVGHGNAPPIPEELSESLKDFVKHCLEVNPMKRPTATALLEHQFVRSAGSMTPRNSGPLALPSSNSLQTITEERSADMSTEQSTQANESLANGHANPTSS